MSEIPHPTAGDEVTLGALLVLLHGADDPFRTVQATYRTWRHDERLSAAFRADIEQQKRRGASIASATFRRIGDPEPAETQETVRIWRDGARFREEHHGGRRDGYYGVIRFDEPIPAETFKFVPPEGEQVQPTPTRARQSLQPITLTQAQRRAPFTVLMPDRVPPDWQTHCIFVEASQRPPSPAMVSLTYRSDDGHQSVSISQMAAADSTYWPRWLPASGPHQAPTTSDEWPLAVSPAHM